MPLLPRHVPLAVATRGEQVESVHYGSVAVVDRSGRLSHWAGEPAASIFTRSALKPLQALPFVADDGPRRLGFSQAQIAMMCASHAGEPRHLREVADMLARAGNTAADLGCGTHAPTRYEGHGQVPPRPPHTPLAHNCSGKHAGMLAACTLHGWDKRDYLALDHPLQCQIRSAIAEFTGLPESALGVGIDGCSAPNYAMPLTALAQAFARLAAGEGPPRFGSAPATLRDAMRSHAGLVSGAGRGDETLMLAGGGDWIAKIGAEGVQAIGIASRGIGIAIKMADGNTRGLHPAAIAVLEGLGLVDEARRATLARLARRRLTNYRGTLTGEVIPVFQLERATGAA